ncbi:hypothetical protein L9F63_015047, partial [Diploptera punctata]
CLPLLVQLLHAPDSDAETRQRAAQALHNMVHSHPDDKRGRREARVLRLLEQVREYCESLREMIDAVAVPAVEGSDNPQESLLQDDMERHPGPTIAALMKLSFDEEHRHAMCQLGGLHAVAELIQIDHEAHGSTTSDQYCVTLRRYAGMALTNLTFGDGANKALLCSFRPFMKALVAQLKSPSEDLRQVTASVLRNLSWRADGASKQTLREVGAVSGLMQAAMEGKKESTLKSILSALWNLSAHCSINKVDICAVEGALGFLVDMLSYKAPSKTLAIVENAGGILRNISSHIAVREDYRAILREHNCLQVLLQQLKSPSLTIVSNACGTLWNLSARCANDQHALWEMGAVSMLRSLVHSKHKMISMGSSAALKNLLSAKPNNNFPLDSTAKGLCLPTLPSLYVRKQRALEQELDQSLSETCDNIEPSTSPSSSTIERRHSRVYQPQNRHFQQPSSSKRHSKVTVARSDSKDSVTSTLSDTVYERTSTSNIIQRRIARTHNILLVQLNNQRVYNMIIPDRHLLLLSQDLTEVHSINSSSSSSSSNSSRTAEPKQPVDYSLKYVEDDIQPRNNNGGTHVSKNMKMNVVYGDYAETDLDQPTDYSLKYAEDEETEFEKNCQLNGQERERQERNYYDGNDPMHEDTLKTYCTEGTPYETPYNFSTATSMSDLQLKTMPKMNQLKIMQPLKRFQSGISSGLVSPEKPVQYYEEGTPGCFSCSPLSSNQTADKNHNNEIKVIVKRETETSNTSQNEAASQSEDLKEQHRGDREETPLMFSRCSSLGSLSSFEQHSIHDDRSSVISDFSRRTSGIVSPSELPDSPTQTVPASPRHTKPPVDFAMRLEEASRIVSAGKGSVFEDNVVAFKEEDTPVEFSRTTSLSSLSIDDEPKISDDALLKIPKGVCEDALQTYCTEGTPANISHAGSHSDLSVLSLPETLELSDDSSNFSGDNDSILAECIQSGMPKAQEQKKKKVATTAPGGSVSPFVPRQQISSVQHPNTSEGSPSNFSVRSSLSDLTINSSCGGTQNGIPVPVSRPSDTVMRT